MHNLRDKFQILKCQPIFNYVLTLFILLFQGRFSITLMSSGFSKELASIPDGGETSLHLYNAMISLAGV